jgi:cytochrome bd-type quinol oxidase subunit 2
MSAPSRSRASGIGRVLVAVYGVLALAALGRSVFQVIDRFEEAPLAYSLSAVAAVVYVLATIALAAGWDRLAWITVSFELAGVLIVGTLSLVAPQLIGLENANPLGSAATVWSLFGAGYVFVPLVLPVLGIFWLRARSRARVAAGV